MEQGRAGPPAGGPDDRAPMRRVYYFHGFDPATTARYRRIFAASSDRRGVQVGDLPDGDGWTALRDDQRTDVMQCRYEDLVRAWQGGPLWKRIARGLLSLALYARGGALRRMWHWGPRNLVLAVSPVIFLIGLLSTAAVGLAAISPGPVWSLAGAVLSVFAAAVGLRAFYLDLVFDLFSYMQVLARGRGPVWTAFSDRIGILAGGIDRDSPDDVLLVGHSLGGVTVIHAMDALLRDWPADRSIGLLTLGSVHGTVLVQRGAGRDQLAGAIDRITADPRVFWVDISSPRDAFCLPLLDPLVLTNSADGRSSPRILSAQLAHAPRIPGDRRTVFSAMRRHMGYLLAPEQGSGFDYPDTITGVPTLRERFGTRNNSPKARMWQS